MAKYIAKLRLSKDQYLAIMDNALIIVTEDADGKPVRWHLFESGKSVDSSEALELLKGLEVKK